MALSPNLVDLVPNLSVCIRSTELCIITWVNSAVTSRTSNNNEGGHVQSVGAKLTLYRIQQLGEDINQNDSREYNRLNEDGGGRNIKSNTIIFVRVEGCVQIEVVGIVIVIW